MEYLKKIISLFWGGSEEHWVSSSKKNSLKIKIVSNNGFTPVMLWAPHT